MEGVTREQKFINVRIEHPSALGLGLEGTMGEASFLGLYPGPCLPGNIEAAQGGDNLLKLIITIVVIQEEFLNPQVTVVKNPFPQELRSILDHSARTDFVLFFELGT